MISKYNDIQGEMVFKNKKKNLISPKNVKKKASRLKIKE